MKKLVKPMKDQDDPVTRMDKAFAKTEGKSASVRVGNGTVIKVQDSGVVGNNFTLKVGTKGLDVRN